MRELGDRRISIGSRMVRLRVRVSRAAEHWTNLREKAESGGLEGLRRGCMPYKGA